MSFAGLGAGMADRLEIGVTNTLANRYAQRRSSFPVKPSFGSDGPVRLIPAKVVEGSNPQAGGSMELISNNKDRRKANA